MPTDQSWKITRKKQPVKTCDSNLHPNHHREIERVESVKNRLESIDEMLSGYKYWVEVIEEIKEVRQILTQIEGNIHERHVAGCLRDGLESKDQDVIEEQIEEMVKVFKRYGG
ncbi:metal-sensing transcriptional repressor [bacterium]|jgi:CsoR family transcriptional regulator, copper-sensing transcriptional repressor|nr:metal-sensing transcriptional repressor [bacterium]